MGLIGRPELASDPRFVDAKGRVANSNAMLAILDEVFGTRTLEEWKAILVRARGAWAPIQTPEEVYTDPQAVANGFVRPVAYPGGDLKMPVPPIMFDEEAGDPPRAPDFAEHSEEILRGLGCNAEEIGRYRDSGVVI